MSATLEESLSNLPLIGPTGVGKMHLAVGLARAAVHASRRTYIPHGGQPRRPLPPGAAASALFQVVTWAVCEDIDHHDDKPQWHVGTFSPSMSEHFVERRHRHRRVGA
ncbi:ATP-binding protein [Rhodococcus sp. WAY2]|uniref:ATP-binding protein n=1 Tax=Rhodococcus sp. WAY2 TaxID=2663121 RepID=UPI003FA6A5A3